MLVSAIGFLSGCKKKDEKKSTDLNISIVPLQGETVDVSTLSVELHSSALYNNIVYSAAASGSTTSSTANFTNLEPGTYYLMAWRDVDNNGEYSNGDIFGFYVEPMTVTKGMQYNVTLEMYEL